MILTYCISQKIFKEQQTTLKSFLRTLDIVTFKSNVKDKKEDLNI